MGIFFIYILKSSVCLAGFYLFYRLLLSKETFHRFNRIVLLSLLLFSLLIPLIQVTAAGQSEVHRTMLTIEQLLLMAGENSDAVAPVAKQPALPVIQVALIVYLLGILFFAFRNACSLVRLLMLLRSGKAEKMERGIRLVVHQKDIAPFSWMKHIVISEKDLAEDGREILIHEAAHIRNRHSIDLLVADVCIFFQWFNPAAWLLKQELQSIHEYEADETVIREGVDAKQYQLLLIKKAVGTRLYSMANSFNHSKLKKRITMMMKKKSNPWARLKYAYVLPLAAIAVTAFARPEVSDSMKEISAVKVNDLKEMVETKVLENTVVADLPVTAVKDTVKRSKAGGREGTVFTVVDHMPEYPGGMNACINFIKDNVRYPAEAAAKGVQGRVIVQFVVNEDGTISDPKIVRSVDPALDAEAIRVVSSMSKWKPGLQGGQAVKVKYTLPVAFNLMKTGNEKTGTPMSMENGVKPLIVINGKEVPNEVLEALDPNKIQSVSVLKDQSAVSKYGEKGKNGVIQVTLKPANSPLYVKVSTDGDVKVANKAIEVRGAVKDEYGKPMIGASVLLEGTTSGTISDADGNFVLKAPEGASIAISYVGMQTAKVKAAEKVDVALNPVK